jgi:O-antigen ligase
VTTAALVATVLVLPWLIVTAVVRPSALTYVVFAAVPLQFLIVPVSTFFISPADVLVLVAAGGIAVRLAAGRRATVTALWQHRFLLLFVLAYFIGFLALEHFSRAIVRVPLAIVPSILACETLRDARHFRLAAGALVIAAIIDAGYGAFWYAQGAPLHPTRFAGMNGPNFSAMVILLGAAVLLAQRARAWSARPLVVPGALTALGLSTLSLMGAAALAAAWSVLRRVMSWRTTLRLAGVGAVILVAALSSGDIRERLLARVRPDPQPDGIARTSVDIRWMLQRTAWQGFTSHPAVGIGYGRFERYSIRDPGIAAVTRELGHGTHNTYLEILVEGGLLAFLFFGLHFLQYLRPLAGALRDMRRHRNLDTAAALVGLPIVLVCAAVANILTYYLFWAVAGLALARLSVRHDIGVQAGHLAVARGPGRVAGLSDRAGLA